MSFYTLPPSLEAEIGELEGQIRQFQAGQLDPTAFKARRVPFGIYEQHRDNTYMVRVRCPGGAVTPLQLRTIAEVSQAYAADTLHITTRQELQLHDVALDNVIPHPAAAGSGRAVIARWRRQHGAQHHRIGGCRCRQG